MTAPTQKQGFSLLEITLSIAIFLIIIVLLISTITQGLRDRNKSSSNVNLPKIQSQVISDIVDQARWAKNVHLPDDKTIEVTNQQGEQTRYWITNTTLFKTMPDGTQVTLTPDNIDVTQFKISYIPPDYSPTGFQIDLTLTPKNRGTRELTTSNPISVRIGYTTYPGMPVVLPTATPTP